MRQALGLTRHSSFEDAAFIGERFVTKFKLGDTPAMRLAEIMQQELDILVLMVDTCEGISGAACRLPDLDTVLIARHEIEGRRHFDLAHELFHILTWDVMPPEHYEEILETGGNRVEQLANSFASALLMPSAVLEKYGDWSSLAENELIAKLNTVADELRVTSSALRWRLVTLGKLKPAVARALPDAALRNNGRKVAADEPPPLFSKPFTEVLGLAIQQGIVSVRRVAGLLNLTVDDLADLFAAHGVDCAIEL